MRGWTVRVVVGAFVAASLVGGALASCGDHSLTLLQQSDEIRIGYAVEAPFAFLGPTGEVTGESPEVAKHVVAELGIHSVRWVLTDFKSLIPGLEAGRYDVVAAGMFISKTNAVSVSFSEPTFRVQQGLVVPQSNPLVLHSYEAAVSNPAARVAVVSGAVEEGLLRDMGMPEARLVRVPDFLAGVRAVESGAADALALSSPTFRWMETRGQLGVTAIATPFEQPQQAERRLLGFGGFAFRKEDKALREAWNDALGTYVGTPEHLALLASLGMTADELPGDVTTSQILKAE